MRKVAGIALVVALAWVTPAEAAPALSLSRADRAADREARASMEEDQALWRDYQEYLAGCDEDDYDDLTNCRDPDAEWYIASYEAAPCVRITPSRALCDVVYRLNNGSECESEIAVRTTSRGRVSSRTLDFDCEAEPL